MSARYKQKRRQRYRRQQAMRNIAFLLKAAFSIVVINAIAKHCPPMREFLTDGNRVWLPAQPSTLTPQPSHA